MTGGFGFLGGAGPGGSPSGFGITVFSLKEARK
jgi:hypothetical protein